VRGEGRNDPATSLTLHGEKILGLLRERPEQIVSGEELRLLLGVSRTAVWKQIKLLRNAGYTIEALPSQGYRLLAVPEDRLIPSEILAGLTLVHLGGNVICYREIDSTNLTAFQLAEEGKPEGTVIIAESQRHGKGRLGREWQSPSGVNLYCSVILRPPITPVTAFQLTFLSAVAVARAVEKITPLSTVIKWPNDILINGKKIAGLLNEMSAETEKVNFLILGIGVNINMRADQFPLSLRHPATSLFLEGGRVVSRNDFLRSLLKELDELYDSYLSSGYQSIRDEWEKRCNVIGRRVRVSFNEEELTGIVEGTDDFGALLVARPDGNTARILAGDVTLL
jgi:BirA family biotin operon repressor/biotin-[acetyl-CoA-carboxylase] ligase